jgi:hypothetical protein
MGLNDDSGIRLLGGVSTPVYRWLVVHYTERCTTTPVYRWLVPIILRDVPRLFLSTGDWPLLYWEMCRDYFCLQATGPHYAERCTVATTSTTITEPIFNIYLKTTTSFYWTTRPVRKVRDMSQTWPHVKIKFIGRRPNSSVIYIKYISYYGQWPIKFAQPQR